MYGAPVAFFLNCFLVIEGISALLRYLVIDIIRELKDLYSCYNVLPPPLLHAFPTLQMRRNFCIF